MLTHSKRALVIDDHAPQRFVVAQLLRRLGFSEVHESTNAEEASRLLTCEDEPAFDLVVSDLQMPCMDGVEFIRRFKYCPDKIPALI
ncbi:MAG: response regulator, partial [Burkholderiales bacterium]|nr:response regulator [Burkholderiales bacterium]